MHSTAPRQVNWPSFCSGLHNDNVPVSVIVCVIGNVSVPATVYMAFRVGAEHYVAVHRLFIVADRRLLLNCCSLAMLLEEWTSVID